VHGERAPKRDVRSVKWPVLLIGRLFHQTLDLTDILIAEPLAEQAAGRSLVARD
jgi:hypothetical protein